jgi:Trypsin-like peptidase domain
VTRPTRLLLVGSLSLFVFAHICLAEPSHTSFFNSQWLQTVVSIDMRSAGDQKKYLHIGTGFLVRSSRSRYILVTAKHVVPDQRIQRKLLVYRLASATGIILVQESQLVDGGLGDWFTSTSFDVACRFIGFPKSTSPSAIPADAFMAQGELEPGAPLLVLGFPYGEPKEGLTRAIVRHGTFAGTDDNGNLMADAFVFPGNSGGPVVYTPPIKWAPPLSSSLVNDERLVGLVVTYTEFQRKSPSAYMETVIAENTGLASLVPASAIQQLVARRDVDALDEALSAKSP